MSRTPLSIMSVSFWKAYLIEMRPYSLFISGIAGLLGLAFIPHPTTLRLFVAFIPLFLSYGLGNGVTASFQTDTDAISSPYRPLGSGLISPKQSLIISLSGLGVGALVIAMLNPVILVFGLAAVIGLLTYTPFKRTWWGGPPWNSWIIALLPIMGRLVDRSYSLTTFFYLEDRYCLSFFLAVLVIFFGYANFVIMGYFKDISADRKTGYHTFPVVFGWKAAAFYSDITALITAILTCMALNFLNVNHFLPIAIFGIAVIINLYAQVSIHMITEEEKSYGPIADVVRAFILYCTAVIVCLKPGWVVLLGLYYILFEIVLRLRTEKTQI